MATFRRRNGKWQAQVRRAGARPISRTFLSLREAKAWARDAERQIDRGQPVPSPGKGPPLDALLERYVVEVTPTKRSAPVERYRIGLIRRHAISKVPANRLTSAQIAEFREQRLKRVSGETVRQDLVLIHQVLEIARREWGLVLPRNPAKDVRKPSPAPARARRLVGNEGAILEQALSRLRNPIVQDAIRFALASGMRRGEILRIEWRHIDWKLRVLHIPESKSGHARFIPISRVAETILRGREEGADSDRVFPTTANAVRLAWQRLRRKAGLNGLRFHDLRHEAISRFFELGLSVPEAAMISGHRDPRMLMRYTHLNAARIAEKLQVPE